MSNPIDYKELSETLMLAHGLSTKANPEVIQDMIFNLLASEEDKLPSDTNLGDYYEVALVHYNFVVGITTPKGVSVSDKQSYINTIYTHFDEACSVIPIPILKDYWSRYFTNKCKASTKDGIVAMLVIGNEEYHALHGITLPKFPLLSLLLDEELNPEDPYPLTDEVLSEIFFRTIGVPKKEYDDKVLLVRQFIAQSKSIVVPTTRPSWNHYIKK